jgi:hypothetical protein
MSNEDFVERALRDPRSVFATPEAVLESDQLPPEHKRTVLERWREQASTDTADSDNLATRLGRALAFMDTETGAQPVTHDQGFYTAVDDAGKG